MRQNFAVLIPIPFKHSMLMFIPGNIKLILNYRNFMSRYAATQAPGACYNCAVLLGKTELRQALFETKYES